MPDYSSSTPRGWLAFELSVLRRLRFRSLVNPFAGEPDLETHVKRWGVRVAANDAARWSWIKGIARVENNAESLSADRLDGEIKQPLPLTLGMLVGAYPLSLEEETGDLRQPLSRVLRRLHEAQ